MKVIINSLEEVPEALRAEYEEKDGKFVVKLDGSVPGFVSADEHSGVKSRLVEFRDNNIKMLKEVAAITGETDVANFDGLKTKLSKLTDLEKETEALRAKVTDLEKSGGGKDNADIAAIIKEQVQASEAKFKSLVESLQTDLAKEKTAREEATVRANQGKLRELLGAQATKAGVRPNALSFILDRAEESFLVEENKIKTKDNIFSVARPGDPLDTKEWLELTMKEFDFAFEKSGGGDTTTTTGDRTKVKPGTKKLVNPTAQELGENMAAIAKGEVVIVNS